MTVIFLSSMMLALMIFVMFFLSMVAVFLGMEMAIPSATIGTSSCSSWATAMGSQAVVFSVSSVRKFLLMMLYPAVVVIKVVNFMFVVVSKFLLQVISLVMWVIEAVDGMIMMTIAMAMMSPPLAVVCLAPWTGSRQLAEAGETRAPGGAIRP